MTKLDLTARITADASPFEGEIKKVSASADRMSKDVAGSAKRAGDAVDKIGDGANQSAEKFTRAGARIRDEIQRSTTAIENFGKSASQKLELKIAAKGLDPAQFQPYLAKLREVENAQNGLGKSFGTLRSAAAGLVGVLGGLGVGIGIGGLVSIAKASINALDAFNDLKDATGASIENISALDNIASRTGTSFDTVSSALIKLNQALNTAKPGSDAEKAIQAIGLSVKDLKDLDPAEAFQKVAVALNGFADDSNKARLTQELFGKSLKEVAPLLKDVAENGKLVASTTTEQAEAAETFNKQLFALKTNSADAARAISVELLPVLIEIADVFKSSKDEAGGLAGIFGGALKTTLQASTILFANVSFVLKGVGREIGAIAAQTVALAKLDIKGFTAISDTVKADGVQARKELDALERRILGVGSLTVISNNQSEAESRRLGPSGGPGKKSVGDIGGGVDKAAVSAANRELEEQRKIVAELSGLTGSFSKEWEQLAAIYKKGGLSLQGLTDAQAALLAKQPAIKAASDAQAAGLKAEIKAYEDYAKATEDAQKKILDGYLKGAESAQAKLASLQDEEKAAALAAASNVSLAEAVEQVAIARLREAQAKALSEGAEGATLLALQNEIAAREKILKLLGSKATRDSAADAAKEAASEWKKASEQIENSITDALLRGFESGKGFAENLRDTVVNMFKTLVLRPIISAVVNPVAGALAGGLGLSGAANAATGAAGLGASLSGLGSVFGSNLAANFVGTLSTGFAGLSTTLSSGLAAIGTGSATSIAAGLGQLAGAAGPFALVAVGIAGILSALKGGEYVQSLGETVAQVTADRVVSLGGSGGTNDVSIGGGLNIRQTTTSDTFAQGLADAFVKASARFGVTRSAASFGFGSNNSDGGKFGLTTTANGQTLKVGDIKTTDAALQLEASRAVFFALQSSELPGFLSKVFTGLTASTATQDQITATLAYAETLKQVRDALTETRTPLEILQANVTAAFATLGTSAATFKTDFVAAIDGGITPDKLAQFQALGAGIEQLAQASGVAAPAVEALGRSLADIANERKNLQDQLDSLTLSSAELLTKQRDALDESNRALFDQVQSALSAKDAAQALADAQVEQADAAEQLAQRIKSAFATLGDTRFGLENQILGLQGNTGEITARTRARDIASLTEGITDQSEIDRITAAVDYNLSLQAQIESLNAAKTAAEESARAQERAANDQASAAADAARAADQIKSAYQSITDSIFAEVARIRALTTGNAAQSFAGAQANFSIAAAQASSGNQDAAKALPELSKILLALAETNATSLTQLRAIQGQTAGTLEGVGNRFVNGLGLTAPTQTFTSSAFNPASANASTQSADLSNEIAALRTEIESMRALQTEGNVNTKKSADILNRVTRGGDAMQTQVFV